MGNIILLSGGTGVGTSTLALELAKVLDIPSVISTDAIREVIRTCINPHLYPSLLRSQHAPARKTQDYLENLREIRWIHDYILSKASSSSIVVTVDNNKSVEQSLGRLLEQYAVWKST